MAGWKLLPGFSELHEHFPNLEAVFALKGEFVTRDPLSEVIRVELDGTRYYVKRYWGGGKGLRRFVGRPRIKAEWQNLRLFIKWGIPTVPVVAYGLERRAGSFRRGALITREVQQTSDLAALARDDDRRLHDRQWVEHISRQLAVATRTLHEHRFAHNDLKWRNLLVNQQGELFLIDCPSGSFWHGPFLRHRVIKDLACLDKVAKYHLSRTQRMRFFRYYSGKDRFDAADKRMIREILSYFEGRE